MPHYFFDVDDGISSPDDEGIDFSSADVAHAQAMRAAGSMLRERTEFAKGQTWKMIVRDETGVIITTLSFTAS